MDHREVLNDLFHAALHRVGGRPAVRRALEADPPEEPVHVVAIGKAASAMTSGAVEYLGDRILDGLVVTKEDHLGETVRQDERFQCLEAPHPVPDVRSLEAGEALVRYLKACPADNELLLLISGGASSLVEVLPEGFGPDALAELNQHLLARHLDIGGVNTVRRAVSCIKGGRLAAHLEGRSARLLLISDVPGDDPTVIGSGLFVPSEAGPAAELPAGLPDWVDQARQRVPAPPAANDPALAGLTRRIIASNADACRAVVQRAGQLGLPVVGAPGSLQGDALEAGAACARALMGGGSGVQVWGGETTVALPPEPGAGGRCQALALTAALSIEGQSDMWLLAAGTDGTDGPGDAAGALVDTRTCFRGRQAGLDPDTCLDAADSGRFLEASGDLLRTGPTGTNVMDVVIGLR